MHNFDGGSRASKFLQFLARGSVFLAVECDDGPAPVSFEPLSLRFGAYPAVGSYNPDMIIF
jgi:hypothetical protein